MKILFVCSGNICRSPMAASYFRHRAARADLSHIVVDSAGTLGIDGAEASPEAIEAMAEIGIDLSAHRSRGITEGDMRTSDMIVVMALHHFEELELRFHGTTDRIVLLRAFEEGSTPQIGPPDLDDPIGARIGVYHTQRDLISGCLDHLALHLKHRAGAGA